MLELPNKEILLPQILHFQLMNLYNAMEKYWWKPVKFGKKLKTMVYGSKDISP